MKATYTFGFLFLLALSASAQSGQWTWLKGSNVPKAAGTYGIIGVPSPANEPPALYEPCEWTDTAGNFWLYGGVDAASNTHNDLWRYSPAANEWTWMSGTNAVNDAAGSFGIRGVPSPSNRPPSIGYGAATWVDLKGNFWMFGGGFSGAQSGALWKYDVSTNEWTWMKGPSAPNQPGVDGIQGVPDTANTPVYRTETAASWTDDAGDLWLFGGNSRNDLWRYNIATNTWTWMKGSSGYYAAAVYGLQGYESPGNTPGARYAYAKWKDSKGNLWLFGGGLLSMFTYMSDMWRYNPVTNNWAWMGGPNLNNKAGVYGSRCITDAANIPGSRWENRAVWTDPNGNFWMFGGGMNDGARAWNDLWMYCLSSGQWTWMGGANYYNAPGNWGVKGTSSPANVPNGRYGAISWTDGKGHLYLFGGAAGGGSGLTPYNDVWKYTIDNGCGTCASLIPPPAVSFQASDTALCANDCVDFTNLSTNATSWQWSFPGGTPFSSTAENPQSICYQSPGTYTAALVASNVGGSATLTINNYIKVESAPKTPFIAQSNDSLYCSTDPSYTSYQWYADSVLIPGATDTLLVITQSGNYNIRVTGLNGCEVAVGINIVLGVNHFTKSLTGLAISPNPAERWFTVHGLQFAVVRIEIYNTLGQLVYVEHEETRNKKQETFVDVSYLPPGIYFVQLSGEMDRYIGRFIKE